MKVVSWNVNSLRVRLPQVLQWIQQHQPAICALQEIKILNENFPHAAFTELGYHAVVNGQKTYNGVAILTRLPCQVLDTGLPAFSHDPQRRMLAVEIQDLCVINIYVPNGEATDSPKYQYKLQWLHALQQYLSQRLMTYKKLIVLGDFNIAPTDNDVHDPIRWKDKVLCSEAERKAFLQLLNLGLVDSFRLFSQKNNFYSWWDYRTFAFKRNAGLRIDHILVSQALTSYCQNCEIDIIPRTWEQPSDHAPVVLNLME